MADKRIKAKGRRESGHFARVPYQIIQHPNFCSLGGNAIRLMLQLMTQLRFEKGGGVKNNGDLCLSWSIMEKQGWRSKQTLQRARDELVHYGFIILTRMGYAMVKGQPNLYALTLYPINECGGKLDVNPTRAPLGTWKQTVPPFVWQKSRTGKRRGQGCTASKDSTPTAKTSAGVVTLFTKIK